MSLPRYMSSNSAGMEILSRLATWERNFQFVGLKWVCRERDRHFSLAHAAAGGEIAARGFRSGERNRRGVLEPHRGKPLIRRQALS